jgi:hypothetical protein
MPKLFSLIILCSLGLCLSAQNKPDIIFDRFPVEKKVMLKELFPFENGEVFKLFVVGKSLFLLNLAGGNDYFFYEYDLNKKQLINKYLQKGTGYGETLSGFSGGIYNNCIWFYTSQLGKLIRIDVKSGIDGKAVIREDKIKGSYYDAQLWSQNKLLTAGKYYPGEGPVDSSKIQTIDLQKGNSMGHYGKFAVVPPGVPYNSWKMAHDGFLTMNPAHNKIALAYRYTDKVEIFDLKNGKSKLISGPEKYETAFYTFKSQGIDVSSRLADTRFAFSSGAAATAKYLYLLYCGKKEDETRYGNQSSDYIYIYSWNGKPVAKLVLDKPGLGIGVSPDDKILYVFDKDRKMIMYASLTL